MQGLAYLSVCPADGIGGLFLDAGVLSVNPLTPTDRLKFLHARLGGMPKPKRTPKAVLRLPGLEQSKRQS